MAAFGLQGSLGNGMLETILTICMRNTEFLIGCRSDVRNELWKILVPEFLTKNNFNALTLEFPHRAFASSKYGAMGVSACRPVHISWELVHLLLPSNILSAATCRTCLRKCFLAASSIYLNFSKIQASKRILQYHGNQAHKFLQIRRESTRLMAGDMRCSRSCTPVERQNSWLQHRKAFEETAYLRHCLQPCITTFTYYFSLLLSISF